MIHNLGYIPSNNIVISGNYFENVYTIKNPLWLNIMPGEENMALGCPVNNLQNNMTILNSQQINYNERACVHWNEVGWYLV